MTIFERMGGFAGSAKRLVLVVLVTLLRGNVSFDEVLRLPKLAFNLGGNV